MPWDHDCCFLSLREERQIILHRREVACCWCDCIRVVFLFCHSSTLPEASMSQGVYSKIDVLGR